MDEARAYKYCGSNRHTESRYSKDIPFPAHAERDSILFEATEGSETLSYGWMVRWWLAVRNVVMSMQV